MSYMHIDNLYKNQDIITLFKRCYAMEKIHGTSANIKFSKDTLAPDTVYITFSSGGEKHERFKVLFNEELLKEKFKEIGVDTMVVYGEAYGGRQQGMSNTYGKELKFIAFEVRIGGVWLNVLKAQNIVKQLELEFVHYVELSTDIDELNAERDKPSVQAKRNGILEDKIKEGIVLRPLEELTKNNGLRIISKHKRNDFRETTTIRTVSQEKLQIIAKANTIADEWVTEMRLIHVLDKFPDADITKTGHIIQAMVEDVKRESEGEVIWGQATAKAISKKCAIMFKRRLGINK